MQWESELQTALQMAEERRERTRQYQNKRHREAYRYLRDCGVPYDLASVAAFWGKKRIEQLLDEIARE